MTDSIEPNPNLTNSDPPPVLPNPLTGTTLPPSTTDPAIVTVGTVGAHSLPDEIHPLTDEEIHASNIALTSRMENLTEALNKKVEQDEFHKTIDNTRRGFFKGLFGIVGVWIVEICVAIYLLINAIHADDIAKQANARSACQSRFNIATNKALQERALSASRQNTALDDFMNIVFDPKTPVSEKTKAAATLHTAIHNAATSRDANPLPTEVC